MKNLINNRKNNKGDRFKKTKVVICLLAVLLVVGAIKSQNSFQNFGNVQIHNGGEVGFHTNLVNNGNFDQNLGLVVFFSDSNQLEVSGINKPIFNDVEVDVVDGLLLNTSMSVKNNLSFISGRVITLKNDVNISLEFLNYNVYSGEGDYEYVDGYVSTINMGEFIFPIGDDSVLRPMILPDQLPSSIYKGAYFKENPNFSSTFSQSFNTSNKQLEIDGINEIEFWDLDGTEETNVILTWNPDSEIEILTSDLRNLRIVGWDKRNKEWVDLGGETIIGDLDNGTIKSKNFIPDNYEVLTIGVDSNEVLGISIPTNFNFSFSPNGDGINDFLVIEGIKSRPNNTLKIVNRWGTLVYSKKNYDNTWDGNSEHKLTINKSNGLPRGTYFYTLDFHGENKSWSGYIYIMR